MGKKDNFQKNQTSKKINSSFTKKETGYKKRKGYIKNRIPAVLNIKSTSNNTIVSLCTFKGAVLAWSSCGSTRSIGSNAKKFKGHQKKTDNAAFLTLISICRKAKKKGISHVFVCLKGYGRATNVIFKVLKITKLSLIKLKDVTPVAYNGCRPPKKRRKKIHLRH